MENTANTQASQQPKKSRSTFFWIYVGISALIFLLYLIVGYASAFMSLFFLSLVGLAVGFFKPSLFAPILGKNAGRKKMGLVIGGVAVASLIISIIGFVTMPPTPEITIDSPESNQVVTEKEITISGKVVPPDSEVGVNGEKIEAQEDGTFSYKVQLEEGVNDFLIVAIREGKKGVVRRSVKRELTKEEKTVREKEAADKKAEEEKKKQEEANKKAAKEAKLLAEKQAQKEVAAGLGISRKEVTSVLEDPAIGFSSFEKGVRINGQDNYTSSLSATTVQLIGPSENLAEASIIALLGEDEDGDFLSLVRVIGFANIIDENAVDWVTAEFEKITSSPGTPYSNSKIFNSREFNISFEPTEFFNSLNLSVKASR